MQLFDDLEDFGRLSGMPMADGAFHSPTALPVRFGA